MSFREYTDTKLVVKEHYRKIRTNQTFEYVQNMLHKYCTSFDLSLTIWEAMDKLKDFIDISDPDINLPNLHHLFQTAEAIRNDGHPDWLQLVGLIHDLGKMIYLKGCDEDGITVKEQWGIVGDTFLVGCRIPDCTVYPEFNLLNPDMQNSKYNTEIGIYTQECGLDACYCAFGHDEYLYQVLLQNDHSLPEEALYIIRYHSLFPWHQGGVYQQLMNEKDKRMLKWVKLFNKYDLYSKIDIPVDIDVMKDYYQDLIDKYLGKKLKF